MHKDSMQNQEEYQFINMGWKKQQESSYHYAGQDNTHFKAILAHKEPWIQTVNHILVTT